MNIFKVSKSNKGFCLMSNDKALKKKNIGKNAMNSKKTR